MYLIHFKQKHAINEYIYIGHKGVRLEFETEQEAKDYATKSEFLKDVLYWYVKKH